jgi:hypothetical protein
MTGGMLEEAGPGVAPRLWKVSLQHQVRRARETKLVPRSLTSTQSGMGGRGEVSARAGHMHHRESGVHRIIARDGPVIEIGREVTMRENPEVQEALHDKPDTSSRRSLAQRARLALSNTHAKRLTRRRSDVNDFGVRRPADVRASEAAVAEISVGGAKRPGRRWSFEWVTGQAAQNRICADAIRPGDDNLTPLSMARGVSMNGADLLPVGPWVVRRTNPGGGAEIGGG